METDNGKKKTNAPPKGEPRRAPAAGADREGPGPEGNAPPLRFPGFQGEWEERRLGEVCERVISGNSKVSSGEFNVYGSTGIIGKTDKADYYGCMLIVARVGANAGKIQLVNERCGITDNALIMKDINQDVCFVYYFLLKHNLNRLVFGSGQPLLTGSMLRNITTHFPSLPEQRKIAGFLRLLDERIAAQRALIGEMGRLIKGLNDTIYSRYCTEEETSFSKIGISYCGLQGKSAEDFGFGKPYISYLKVHNNRILDDSECELVNIRSGERQNLVRHGDVLFTLSSETPEEVGLGAVYLGTKEVYLNSFCFGIHFINPIVFPPYMAFFISTSYFRKFIFPFAQGSTRYNLQKADFEKATLHLPNLDHQKKIYAIMKSITHKLELEKRILQDYLLQKQYLLRQMFI